MLAKWKVKTNRPNSESDTTPVQFNPIPCYEWLYALILAIAVALLMLIPYLPGYLTAVSPTTFTGLIMNPEDAQTYWAKMLQGYNGAWLYTIPFTPELHEGAMVGLFYLWLGQMARFLRVSLTAVWHLSRFLSSILLFIVTFGFVSSFFADRRARWTAYLLAVFGSGLGWLLFILQTPYFLGKFPVDFKQPGAHLFFTAMTFPHISIGTACILVSIWAVRKVASCKGQVASGTSQFTIHYSLFIILANVSNLILGIVYPFLIYIIIATAVIHWLALSINARRPLWKLSFRIGATFILPAPLYIYYIYILQTNPVFRAWDAQAGTPAAPWPHYLIAFGPYLLLAFWLWRKRPLPLTTSTTAQYKPLQQSNMAILWQWLLVVALLLYAPLRPQRRFIQGLQVPLSILATGGLLQVIFPRLTKSHLWQRLIAYPRYKTSKMIRLLLLIFLLGMSISNIYLWTDVVRTAVIVQPDPLFRSGDEFEATNWLRENASPSDLILGELQTGNLVAARAGQRVMLGHWAETVDYEEKTAVVTRFFDSSTADDWRINLLSQYEVNYVWVGPRENALGNAPLNEKSYLVPVYENKTITIYAVELE